MASPSPGPWFWILWGAAGFWPQEAPHVDEREHRHRRPRRVGTGPAEGDGHHQGRRCVGWCRMVSDGVDDSYFRLYGNGSKPFVQIFCGWTSIYQYLPSILGSLGYQGFDPYPYVHWKWKHIDDIGGYNYIIAWVLSMVRDQSIWTVWTKVALGFFPSKLWLRPRRRSRKFWMPGSMPSSPLKALMTSRWST